MRDKTTDFEVGRDRQFVITQISSFFTLCKERNCSRKKHPGLIIDSKGFTSILIKWFYPKYPNPKQPSPKYSLKKFLLKFEVLSFCKKAFLKFGLDVHRQQVMRIDNFKAAKLKFLSPNEIPMKLKYRYKRQSV